MGDWLVSIRHTLRGTSQESAEAASLVRDAWRRRARVDLHWLRASGEEQRTAITVIEQVDRREIVVALPMAGGAARPLIAGEPLAMFLTRSDGRHRGETVALGRITLPSGAAGTFHGYRLAMPERFEHDERRQRGRVLIGFDLAPEARVLPVGRIERPFVGFVHDIGVGGCLVRSRGARGRVKKGDPVAIFIAVPEGPTIEESATVTHVRSGKNPEDLLVGFRFGREVVELAEFVRMMEVRRRQRWLT
ncbi:MAG: PilZ domain-containing protein [Phycisphaerales bacterium]|nr:PilZ domain-containing protein [Phycisphaerales bacterium]